MYAKIHEGPRRACAWLGYSARCLGFWICFSSVVVKTLSLVVARLASDCATAHKRPHSQFTHRYVMLSMAAAEKHSLFLSAEGLKCRRCFCPARGVLARDGHKLCVGEFRRHNRRPAESPRKRDASNI